MKEWNERQDWREGSSLQVHYVGGLRGRRIDYHLHKERHSKGGWSADQARMRLDTVLLMPGVFLEYLGSIATVLYTKSAYREREDEE